MNEAGFKIMKLIEFYMDKTLSEGCLLKTPKWEIVKLFRIVNYPRQEIDETRFSTVAPRFTKEYNDFECITKDWWIYHYWMFWEDKIIWHYDITAVFDYINSINLWWVWPYYFDSVSFRKEHYILTPTWDNDYARIPRKPLHLYTETEEKELLDLLLKLK